MTRSGTLHIHTPTYKPVGGVVKLMDYATHALAHGWHVRIWSPNLPPDDCPLFRIERFASLPNHPKLSFDAAERFSMGRDDLILISLPDNYEVAARCLPGDMSPERIVHLVQNVRHVNPEWRHAYPLRLLTRPLARISINQVVADTIAPWLDTDSLHEVIQIGHDVPYFSRVRGPGIHSPMRVAYTTWKSGVGDEVAAALAHRMEFRAVRESVDWAILRELYEWADVFLCTPSPEEGLYLPGVEAMASQCLVVTPDVGGNMAYCLPDKNCVLVGFERVDEYVAALEHLEGLSDGEIGEFRKAGSRTASTFSLDREREEFGDFIDFLWPRVSRFEEQRTSRAASGLGSTI